MSEKTVLLLAGAGVLGYFYWRNKKQVDRKVKRTASIIRRRMEPFSERVTGSLDDLAETIQGVNRRVRLVTAVVDAALERVA